MRYTLTTLKAAVIEAAVASDMDCLAGVTDAKSFAKALRQEYPDQHWDFRKLSSWINMAEWIGIDASPWQQKPEAAPKLAEIKANVLAHYEVANTKALRKKLDGWAIPYTNLRYKMSWEKLWAGAQQSQKAAA